MDLKNNGKLNFVIDLFLPLDKYMSGGNMAMHMLANHLAVAGHNVYIFCEPFYPHENITVIPSTVHIVTGHKYNCTWEPFNFMLNNTISIYPEHSRGNKFNTVHNVRWIMYHTTREDENGFGEDDYIYNFGNFKTYTNRHDGTLKVFNYNLDKFYDEHELFGGRLNKKRKGYCHIVSKHTPYNYESILKSFNSTNITHLKENADLDVLRQELNNYEYFITFDQKTYLTTAAALCGCKVIILKSDVGSKGFIHHVNDRAEDAYTENEVELTPIQYKLENPINLFGVAYGIEDIQWASDTLHMVRDHIRNLKESNENDIKNFITFFEKKLLS